MNQEQLVRMVNISKRFGPSWALKDVNFETSRGEVVGLVGDNGAGKSTLIRVLTGIHTLTTGEIYFEGKKVSALSPKKAISLGIETVHQGFGLLPSMTISRNIFLGEEPVRKIGPFQFIDLHQMEQESNKLLQTIGIMRELHANMKVGKLSGGQQQAIKIGRTIYFKAKLVILDEPTVGLSLRESDRVFELIGELKKRGVAVIYITHRIDEVFDHASRIVILEGGIKLGEFLKEETSIAEVEEIIRTGHR